MKIKVTKHILFILLLLFSITHSAIAQLPDLKLISAASKTISNTTYSIDFTIGESVTTNISNSVNHFTIGFLQ